MMKNRRWKDILLGAVLTAVLSCLVIPALAYSGNRSASLYYDDIQVVLDGTSLTLRDSDGDVVEPFIINGTTYLPLRAIAEALGLDVAWNGSTSTVTLTTAGSESTSPSNYIGEAKAKEIALDHAGVKESNATFLQVRLSRDDGRMEYEVEFWSGNTEYDYDIDALTGDVRSYDRDIDGYTIPSQTGTDIGAEKAKEIALDHAGVKESETAFLHTERDYDDGRLIYDVEFYAGSVEYDYEIDASTGTVLSYDYDAERYTPSQSGSSGNYIGEARAKEIVRERAGVTDGTFREFKLDYDDGRAIYEGELRSGWREYDFEIDAVTGAVLEWSVD